MGFYLYSKRILQDNLAIVQEEDINYHLYHKHRSVHTRIPATKAANRTELIAIS
jgi:hypothetical protein